MRYLVLLVAVALAGCAAEGRLGYIEPEKRPAVLQAFGLEPNPGPYAVIVLAQDEAGEVNERASSWATSFKGTQENWVESSEQLALHQCGLYKAEDEFCYVVYKGGWVER